MTDKQFKKLRKRLIRLGKKWRYVLGLGMWQIDWQFRRDWQGIDMECSKNQWATLMAVSAAWQYQKATISVNMPACLILTKARLEFEFLHELSHILVCEMRSWEKDHDHEERVVTHRSNCLKWTWDKATRSARKRKKK